METRSIQGTEAQGATFVELFFDLVFVFAVTQVTRVLAHDLTWPGVAKALVVFWLVWWAWTQFTWSLNQADTEHASVRLITLVATGLAFVMALTVPIVEDPIGWFFPIAYLLVRTLGIGIQWKLAAGDDAWTGAVRRWTITSSLGLLAVLAAVFIAPEYRFVALGVAALFDISAAVRAGGGEWHLFSSHFSERHGLFVIIVLGESLIAAGLGASGQQLSPGLIGVATIAVLVTCGLWWTYFGWVKEAIESAFAEVTTGIGRFARDVYSFAHFPIIAGVIGFAVATEETIAHPGDPLAAEGLIALVGGVTLFVGGTYLAIWRARSDRAPRVRLVIVGALIVTAPFLSDLAAWQALFVVAILVIGLAFLEQRSVSAPS
jgi:low temperature requirement protein LtrA